MFYSQTFLARKGPLGTVWCAAHLQNRLKKSHYTTTDIPATVDLIMFSEVPIALRMSGHLLLGVVRIFSKKVDYLFQDCNIALTGLQKAFSKLELNLPEESRQVQLNSVTMPESFNLEDYTFDVDIMNDEEDLMKHSRSEEEITLPDQFPVGAEPYVAVTFDDDIFPDSRAMDVDPPTGPADVQTSGVSNHSMSSSPNSRQNLPEAEIMRNPLHETFGSSSNLFDSLPTVRISGPSDGRDIPYSTESPIFQGKDNPDIEIMRDDALREGQSPVLPFPLDDSAKPAGSSDQFMNNNRSPTPVFEVNPSPSGGRLLSQLHSAAQQSVGAGVFEHSTPAMAMQSSPQVEEPRPRKRKLFDREPKLTDRVIRKTMDDPSPLLRKKSNMLSSLTVWKANKMARKEQMFYEPLLTGFPTELSNMFEKDYFVSKPNLAVVDKAATVAQSPAQETENLMDATVIQSSSPTAEADRAPLPDTERVQSHAEETGHMADDMVVSPTSDRAHGQVTDHMADDMVASPTTDRAYGQVTEPMVDDTAVPSTSAENICEDRFPVDSPPEYMKYSAQTSTTSGAIHSKTPMTDLPDLSFIEADNDDTPTTGSEASQGIDGLSTRSRAVVRYLQGCSPTFSVTESPSEGDLSLNKILEGRSSKVAARMFFETLVLKNNKLVDVQQDTPYGDISLKLTSLLSKAQL